MPLGAPAIVGPVTACSSSVRVMGQFSGSRVRIYIRGKKTPIGNATVGFSDAVVSIDSSQLVPGQILEATQKLGNETSEKSPKGVVVDPIINGPVTLPYKVYVCAQSIFVSNCAPGARVEVWQGSSHLGTAIATGNHAWVDFGNKSVGSGQVLEVRQFICTSATPVVTKSEVPVAPPSFNNKLASPKFGLLEECQRWVPAADIIVGARVRLNRQGAPIWNASVPYPDTNFIVDKLVEGEKFELTQTMPHCRLTASPANVAIVQPLTALKRPRIDSPVCVGPHQVWLSRLKPGATVRVYANGVELRRWEAGATSMPLDFVVPAPASLTARQELCSVISPVSRAYTVATAKSGRWFLVEDEEGEVLKAHSFAIHVALARTGKIVMFSGDQHNQAQNEANPQDLNHCELFDCVTYALTKIDAPTTDVFCAGHAFLPDGRLLVMGGTEEFTQAVGQPHAEHFYGMRDTWIFNPIPSHGRHWSKTSSMQEGRWYPTALTLSNGRVLVLSGHPAKQEGLQNPARHNNNTMETFQAGAWTELGDSPDIDSGISRYLYPRVVTDPSGGVFSATPLEGGSVPNPGRSGRWPIGTGVAWTRSALPVNGAGWGGYDGFNMPAVLLPLLEDENPERSFRHQVLLAGEAQPWICDLGTPRAPVSNPSWRAMGARTFRPNSNLVLLPSGEVLLCGGVADTQNDDTAVLRPELLTDVSGSWEWSSQRLAAAKIARNYHSTALLMPDGRVFTGGSNVNSSPGGEDVRRLELEIYEPWYACPDRPRIVSAPTSVRVGHRFFVRVRGPGPIVRLTLIRCGSATHSFNSDQRCIELLARREDDQYIGVTPDAKVAIPGYYLLFAVTDKKVPSRGVFMRIDL